jgi:hypothetical protein
LTSRDGRDIFPEVDPNRRRIHMITETAPTTGESKPSELLRERQKKKMEKQAQREQLASVYRIPIPAICGNEKVTPDPVNNFVRLPIVFID